MTETDGSSDPVILATAGYDHTIKFWQAHSGICHRTVQHPDSVSFIKSKLKCCELMCWTFQTSLSFTFPCLRLITKAGAKESKS